MLGCVGRVYDMLGELGLRIGKCFGLVVFGLVDVLNVLRCVL